MVFYKNQLINFHLKQQTIERIIWIDNNGGCVTIDINCDKAMPKIRTLTALQMMLDDGTIELLYKDPYNIFFLEEELTEAEVKTRDRRWDTIKNLTVLEPDIYYKENIWKTIEENTENLPKVSVLRNLRIFWQRGSTKNALIPNYRFSGGRGIRKRLGDKKTGRPKKFNRHNEGTNVTEEVEYFFRLGIKKFKESKTVKVKDIYLMILNEYFIEDYRYENGEKKARLKDSIPSLRQFRYWYNKNSNLSSETKNINKKGRRNHHLTDRPVLGSSDLYISAPGLKYQIDSTIGDFYLVSEKNPDIVIGRPTIYFVRDVFSRMITGMYVGFQNASWLASSMALLNTVRNKKEYCREYGIEINEDDWPVSELPEALFADRAELHSHKAEQLTDAFGIRIENAPSYRADYKGIVEQAFNMINSKLKPHLSGSVMKEGLVRGERDYRLDARLTLKSFTHALIKTVLFFNNSKWMKGYERDEGMIYDNVPLIPKEIWNWGIKNRSGRLKSFPENYVKLNLLPRYNGTVTRNGIRFKNDIYYSCEKGEREGWFQDAAIKGSWKVTLAYDPRSINQVYIMNEDGSYEVCKLLKEYYPYFGIQIDELNVIRDKQKEDFKRYEQQEYEQEIDLSNSHRLVNQESNKKYKEETNNPSKSAKLKNIRENRKKERERNYAKETTILKEKDEATSLEPGSNKKESDNEKIKEIDPEIAYLMQFRKEVMKDE